MSTLFHFVITGSGKSFGRMAPPARTVAFIKAILGTGVNVTPVNGVTFYASKGDWPMVRVSGPEKPVRDALHLLDSMSGIPTIPRKTLAEAVPALV